MIWIGFGLALCKSLMMTVAAMVAITFSAIVKAIGAFLSRNTQLIGAMIGPLLAVVVSIGFSLFLEWRRKRRGAVLIRGSIKLYLDVLKLKIDSVLELIETEKAGKVIDREFLFSMKTPGGFEKENKINHDAIEGLFLKADALSIREREALAKFIAYFKAAPKMWWGPPYPNGFMNYADALKNCREAMRLPLKERER